MSKNGITVGLAISQYINAKHDVLSPTTIRLYERMYDRYYKDLRYKDVKELTNYDVQMMVNKLKSCEGLSNKAIMNIMALFSKAIKFYSKDIEFQYVYPTES